MAATRRGRSRAFSTAYKKMKRSQLPVQYTNSIKKSLSHSVSCPNNAILQRRLSNSSGISKETSTVLKRHYSKPCVAGCPCPFPCGPCGCKSGCSCLPPPCNTPPRCIQYMTGYYYYPYGTWFCGPYHVTGLCSPMGGNSPPGSCPGPCPKCCAACVCPAPSNEPIADSYKSNPESLPTEMKQSGECQAASSKFFKFADKRPTKNRVPPVFTSMILPYFADNKVNLGDRIEFSYPCSDVKAYHSKNNSNPSIAPDNKHAYNKFSFNQQRNKASSLDRIKSNKKSRQSPSQRLDSLNYSTVYRYKKSSRRPHVRKDFEPFEL